VAELTGQRRFNHLYRRAAFGGTLQQIAAARALHSDENTAFDYAVDSLLSYASVPEVADQVSIDINNRDTLIKWWLDRMVRTSRPLLEKMVLFWHDHFATSFEKDGIDVARMHRQNELFRNMAMGTFEPFLNAVSRDPAMMTWLDLTLNRRNSPNENYAREVMELFTLGIGNLSDANYSEGDIRQATRAFTGYTIDANGNFALNAGQHDSTNKVVLGVNCESGDQVHAILMNYVKGGRKVAAHFLTAKLFSWFAYPVTPDDAVVTRLAPGFAASGHTISWLVQQILKSPEFSSNRAYRAQIKSPVEMAVETLHILGAERIPANGVLNRLSEQGMRLFHPPDVAGWPSGSAWINASTILSRCNMNATVVNSLGKTAATEAGGMSIFNQFGGQPSGTAKVDLLLALFSDSNVTATTRNALISYANAATNDEKMRGLVNLVLALPSHQSN
jgi:uncharacterized protein (DUF1800 family)